jgi:ABC-type nitrate/sulfonate/bicarbonate transport system permease component
MTAALTRLGRRSALVVLLLGIWLFWGRHQPPHSFAPLPDRVVGSLYQLTSTGVLPLSLLTSSERIVLGFAEAFVVAAVLGVAMGYSRAVERSLDPIIQSVRHVAPIAVVPLAVLWFGTGGPAAVFVIAYACFFPLILNVVHGVQDVDRTLIRAASTLGLTRWAVIRHVIWPSALPTIINGSRIAMGLGWMAVVAAELAVSARSGSTSSGGIGQLMFEYYQYSIRTNNLVACMLGVGFVALLIDWVFRGIQRRWLGWATRGQANT